MYANTLPSLFGLLIWEDGETGCHLLLRKVKHLSINTAKTYVYQIVLHQVHRGFSFLFICIFQKNRYKNLGLMWSDVHLWRIWLPWKGVWKLVWILVVVKKVFLCTYIKASVNRQGLGILIWFFLQFRLSESNLLPVKEQIWRLLHVNSTPRLFYAIRT